MHLKPTVPLTKSITTSAFFLALALACFAPSPMAKATDLGSDIGNNNTADGVGVLTSASLTGINNSGFGFEALYSNTSGVANPANTKDKASCLCQCLVDPVHPNEATP